MVAVFPGSESFAGDSHALFGLFEAPVDGFLSELFGEAGVDAFEDLGDRALSDGEFCGDLCLAVAADTQLPDLAFSLLSGFFVGNEGHLFSPV